MLKVFSNPNGSIILRIAKLCLFGTRFLMCHSLVLSAWKQWFTLFGLQVKRECILVCGPVSFIAPGPVKRTVLWP